MNMIMRVIMRVIAEGWYIDGRNSKCVRYAHERNHRRGTGEARPAAVRCSSMQFLKCKRKGELLFDCLYLLE